MYGKMQEFGLSEISPWICTSLIWGQYSVFSHPEFPQDSLWVGSGCCLITTRWQVFFPSWVSLGLTSSPSLAATITDACDILCSLIWDGWMASPTQWTWVWASSSNWWWTGKPDVHGVTKSQTRLTDWTDGRKYSIYQYHPDKAHLSSTWIKDMCSL